MNENYLKNLEAVLFDLDGTLMDTLPGLTQLVNAVRRDFDKRPLPEEEVGRYIGKGMLVLIHRAMTRTMDEKLSEPIFNIALDSLHKHISRNQYDKGTPYKGVISSLQKLREAGITTGVVTNKPYEMTLEVLKSKDMLSLFDFIVGGDSAAAPKPASAPVLLALKKAHTVPEKALFVGDSGNDSQAALAAGVPCVLVRTGWSEGISLSEIQKRDKVNAIFNDVPEVVNAILTAKQS